MTAVVSNKKKSCRDLSKENKKASDKLVRLLTVVGHEDKKDVAITDTQMVAAAKS